MRFLEEPEFAAACCVEIEPIDDDPDRVYVLRELRRRIRLAIAKPSGRPLTPYEAFALARDYVRLVGSPANWPAEYLGVVLSPAVDLRRLEATAMHWSEAAPKIELPTLATLPRELAVYGTAAVSARDSVIYVHVQHDAAALEDEPVTVRTAARSSEG